MKGILCAVLAVCGLCLAFTSEASARGRGGNMMVCNANPAPQPQQATREDLTKKTSQRVIKAPAQTEVRIAETKTRSGMTGASLLALNAAPAALNAPVSMVASK